VSTTNDNTLAAPPHFGNAVARPKHEPDPELAGLAERIDHEYKTATDYAHLVVLHWCRTGGLLNAAKRRYEAAHGYGGWGKWVQAHCKFSERSARQMQQLTDAHPLLADPETDPDQVLTEHPEFRAIAEGPLRKAIQALPGRAEPSHAARHGTTDAYVRSAVHGDATDPVEVLRVWVKTQLPGASRDEYEEVVLTYFGLCPDNPPNATQFEIACAMWNMGRRKPQARRSRSKATP
jgi:hypothetical protein